MSHSRSIRSLFLRWLLPLWAVAFVWIAPAFAKTDKYRLMWREDPATTMVIGWNQVSGSRPVVRYDVVDHGMQADAYAFAKMPDRVVWAKGMHNHFVRLTGLQPNTVYYFVIEDSEGVSPRMYFRTAPDHPDLRLSLVAGGDSRNNRAARRAANLLAGKLRPDCILFGGDMTGGDTDSEWQEWLDDWQLVRASDGYMPPVLVARGNHEMTNEVLVNLFDLKNPDAWYALSLGGDLLRIYTLNSLVPAGGAQRAWLERDLRAHAHVRWKIAQYHFPMRPHQRRKPENNDQYVQWAELFYRHGVRLVCESDAHVVKLTWPVRPSQGPRAYEGFVRDDTWGTVYVGEGGWGAPLRANDDDKPWTRASGSFNQFKWIFVDAQRIEVRTVRVDGAEAVAEVPPHDRFSVPFGLSLWAPDGDEVVVLTPAPGPPGQPVLRPAPEAVAARRPPARFEVSEFAATRAGREVVVTWVARNEPPGLRYFLERSLDGGTSWMIIEATEPPADGRRAHAYEVRDLEVVNRLEQGQQVLYRLRRRLPGGKEEALPLQSQSAAAWEQHPKLMADAEGRVQVAFVLDEPAGMVQVWVLEAPGQAVMRLPLGAYPSGKHLTTIDLHELPAGRYYLLIRADGWPVRRFRLVR